MKKRPSKISRDCSNTMDDEERESSWKRMIGVFSKRGVPAAVGAVRVK